MPAHAVTPTAEELAEAHRWADIKFNGAQRAEPAGPVMRVLTNCHGVQKNSRQGKPLKLSGVDYKREFSSVHAGLELTRGPWKTETE